MKPQLVLDVVLREMASYSIGWRADWSDFDGRILREHMNRLEYWAREALNSKDDSDFTDGTNFLICQTN